MRRRNFIARFGHRSLFAFRKPSRLRVFESGVWFRFHFSREPQSSFGRGDWSSCGARRVFEMGGTQLLGYEPSIQLGLDPQLKTQCRVSFETRTLPFSVRTGEYPEEQLSVYLSLRRVESLGPTEKFDSEIVRLAGIGKGILDEMLVSSVLKPLQRAISLR